VVLGLVAVLLAAALPAPAIASEPSPSYAETRVWGFELQIPAGVGVERGLSADGTKGYGEAYDELAVGYPLVPRGRLVIDAGKFSASEIRSAEHLASLGRDVRLRPPVGTRAAGTTSDLLVNGVTFDVFTPVSTNPNRIISAIAKKNSQARGIVLDLSETTVRPDQLGNILARVRGAGATNIDEIIVIGN